MGSARASSNLVGVDIFLEAGFDSARSVLEALVFAGVCVFGS